MWHEKRIKLNHHGGLAEHSATKPTPKKVVRFDLSNIEKEKDIGRDKDREYAREDDAGGETYQDTYSSRQTGMYDDNSLENSTESVQLNSSSNDSEDYEDSQAELYGLFATTSEDKILCDYGAFATTAHSLAFQYDPSERIVCITNFPRFVQLFFLALLDLRVRCPAPWL